MNNPSANGHVLSPQELASILGATIEPASTRVPLFHSKKRAYTPSEIYDYYSKSVPGLKLEGPEWRGPCPIHGGERDSFAVNPQTGQWYCHSECQEGGSLVDLKRKLSGCDHPPTSAARVVGAPQSERQIVKTYDYVDESGKLLFQVVRYQPKDFRQRKPDGKGGWDWSTKDVRRVLYRLPIVMGAPTVIVVEGEKDVENLERLGFVATCNAGGACKWRPEFADVLAKKDVVIMPDNDAPGRKHADQVVASLRGKAREIRVVKVPCGKDASDWIEAGATKADIEAAIAEAPLATEPAAPVKAPSRAGEQSINASPDVVERSEEGWPEIIVNGRQLRELRTECIQALQARNQRPHLFTRGGALVDLRRQQADALTIVELTDIQLRSLLADAACFYRQTDKSMQGCPPPMDAVRDILCRSQLADYFPKILGIAEAPVLRPDGTVLDQTGYDQATHLYYAPATKLTLPRIPASPARDDIEEALRIVDSAISDFPFADDLPAGPVSSVGDNRAPARSPQRANRANTFAALLTPLLRPLIEGPTPLCLIDAPAAGTGKTLLAEVISRITTGRPAALFSAPRDDEEFRKQITSHLCNGVGVVVIDNIRDKLDSAQLSKALTASVWSDRILGHTKTVHLPVRCTWLATGNNIAVGGDLPRRCYWIRLDARTHAPFLRQGFKHPNLLAWVTENRGALIAALLTLARAWFAAGKPAGQAPVLGSYESWVETVGGILDYAGVHGFMANAVEFRERAQADEGDAAAFLFALYEAIHSKQFTSADVRAMCTSENSDISKALPTALAEVREDAALFQRRLGRWCGQIADRRFGEPEIRLTRARMSHKVQVWKIEIGLSGEQPIPAQGV